MEIRMYKLKCTGESHTVLLCMDGVGQRAAGWEGVSLERRVSAVANKSVSGPVNTS